MLQSYSYRGITQHTIEDDISLRPSLYSRQRMFQTLLFIRVTPTLHGTLYLVPLPVFDSIERMQFEFHTGVA
jgi:hypothetical protein